MDDEQGGGLGHGDPPGTFVAHLRNQIGREISTPQGIGILESVEDDLATVILDHAYPVIVPVVELAALEDALCAVCQNFAVTWCAACGRPVCAEHKVHGKGQQAASSYVLNRVLKKLVRHGMTGVLEPDVAYAVVSLAHAQAVGPVEMQRRSRGGGQGEGVRLILGPSGS